LGSFADGEEDVNSFLVAQVAPGNRIRRIGFFEALEYTNNLLHIFYFSAWRTS
jgi:hypothetical protein